MEMSPWYIYLTFFFIVGIFDLSGAKINQDRKSIPGPKSFNDRIAIIGAGPSGIHMAYRLKALGFRNVEVLERDSRIGGKVFDVRHRGTTHQMTFVNYLDDYVELTEVVKKYTNGKLITPPAPFLDIFGLARTLHPRLTVHRSDQEIQARILRDSQRYIALHRRLLGRYVPFLYPRPCPRVRYLIRGSFADFLRRNHLEYFEVTATFLLSISGYGHLNTVSAVYGLMMLSADTITSSIRERLSPQKLLDIGLLSVLHSLRDKFHIHVKFNVDIKSIKRLPYPKGSVHIQYSGMHGSRRSYIGVYDFLIVSAPMKFLSNIIDVSQKERDIFSRQILDTYFSCTLCDSQYGIRINSPKAYFPQNVLQYDYVPCIYTDNYALQQNITGERYRQGIDAGGKDGERIQTVNYVSIGRKDPKIPKVQAEIDRKLTKFLTNLRRTPCKTIARYQSPYFVRFSIPDTEKGILWDIFDLQGHRNTWYIGAQASFEAGGAVIQYNDRILRSYHPPPKWIF